MFVGKLGWDILEGKEAGRRNFHWNMWLEDLGWNKTGMRSRTGRKSQQGLGPRGCRSMGQKIRMGNIVFAFLFSRD